MNFFKRLIEKFVSPKEENNQAHQMQSSHEDDDLPVDERFVKQFIAKGGKFLYCSSLGEAEENLLRILKENNWQNIICYHPDLVKMVAKLNYAKTQKNFNNLPFFTKCESLIASDGSIMFSSKQLKDRKLAELPENFIVFAQTSQLVNSIREGVMRVRENAGNNPGTIVSAVKYYTPELTGNDFQTYGNTNAKSLYLLLLEDL